MAELIRTRMASSFRIVEETEGRLVLQANWLDHLGCASAFLLFGLFWLFAVSTFRASLSAVIAGAVGVAFCLAGLVALASGLRRARDRIVVDRSAGEVRFVPPRAGPAAIPFDAVARLEQRTIEGLRDADSDLTYYRLYLVTKDGREIELCESRDASLIAELAGKIGGLLGQASAQGPAYGGKPLRYWIDALQDQGSAPSADREAASTALRTIGEAAVPALVASLRHQDAAVRTRAAGALLWMNPKARGAVPALIEALDDPEQWVRHLAAQVLADIGPDAGPAVPALIHRLDDPVLEVRHSVAGALGALGPAARDAIPRLTRALRDEDESVRRWAAEALEKIETR